MKIYDCFPFYNELDLLELRLQELYDHVDHFVLVEGNTTFTNLPKPFYFEQNQSRYQKYLDKIIHVKVTDMPGSSDAWVNDIFQRNCINRGIVDAADDDIIMVSDLDELIRPSVVDQMRQDHDINIWGLRMPLFNFRFNYMLTTADCYAVWSVAARRSVMPPADELRAQRFVLHNFTEGYRDNSIRLVEHAGWQFTYLGDTDFARNKIQSFAHTETNIPEIVDQLDVDRSIQHGDGVVHDPQYRYSPVRLDEYFPATLLANVGKYQNHIIADADKQVFDFLPRTN
jgi:beta-1,4-mannosyl-glycoprotein beta-1,4-N-acetylglucosaminyltransferase